MSKEFNIAHCCVLSAVCACVGFTAGVKFSELLPPHKEQPKPKIHTPAHTWLYVPELEEGKGIRI